MKKATIYLQIGQELNNLPGETAHLEMFPLRKATSLTLPEKGGYKISAVMLLFFIEDSNLMLTLTQRHDYKGTHGGQISFPGGKSENYDKNNQETALRETHEEIGVLPADITIIGKLTDVYIPVSNFLVHPFIGYHESTPQFKASEKEVKEIITFNVAELLNEKNRQTTKIKTSNGIYLKDIPCFKIQNKIVWGATALMLNELKIILKRIY